MASSMAEGEPLVVDSRPKRPTDHWEGEKHEGSQLHSERKP